MYIQDSLKHGRVARMWTFILMFACARDTDHATGRGAAATMIRTPRVGECERQGKTVADYLLGTLR